MNILTKISDGYMKFLKVYLEVVFAAMAVTMTIQVFCRFVLNSPLAWSEELTCYLQVALIFPGIALGVKTKIHIEMSAVYDAVPPVVKLIFDILKHIIVIAVGIIFIRATLIFLTAQKQSALTMRWLRLDYFYLIILWSGITMELYLIADAARFIASLFTKKGGVK
jgi:TRAP-type C4-dicarboxylate transport system permease small subunit